MTTIATELDTTTAGHPIQRIAGRTVLQNPFLRVDTDDVVFPNGAPGSYSVVTSGTGLGVIAIPFVNFRGIAYLGLVKQYRYPMQDYTLEFPRGGSDNLSLDEAARELVEETGLQARTATPLGIIWPDTGILSTQVSVWKTTHASNGLRPDHVEDETGAHILWYTHGEIIGMIRRGQIRCGMTLASLALIEAMGALSCPQ